MVAGVKVVMNDEPGEIPGMGLSAVRYIVTSAGSILGLVSRQLVLLGTIDPVWALFDGRNRCLHDLAAGTVVVRAPRSRRQPMTRSPDEPALSDIDLDRLR